MAKTTKFGGPSYTPGEEEGLEYVPRVRRAEVGAMRREEGETSSPGINSSASSKEQSRSDETRKPDPLEPAPAVESHSSQTVQSDGADSTDGHTPVTAEGSSKAPKKAARKTTGAARSRSMDDPEDDF